MGKICRTCGFENPANASNCTNCGSILDTSENQTVNCKSCGAPNALTASVCEFCGTPLPKHTPEIPPSASPAPNVVLVPKTPTILTINLPASPVVKPQPPVAPPPPLVSKQKSTHVKSIGASILYGCFCLGFFAIVVWIIIILTPYFLNW